MVDQTQLFRESEANQWFARNRKHLEECQREANELPIEVAELARVLSPFKPHINRVLEIGCSSGQKLELICNALDASGEGIEPSESAVAQGNERLAGSGVRLQAGTSDQLPFEKESFDLVYFGFCLYLVDRSRLLASVAEADRVLKKGGFLAITDFDPGRKSMRPYTHREGVFSFKQDYARCFTESGLYYTVSKMSFSHRVSHFDADPEERVSLTLLYKEAEPYPHSGV
jgi:ubiquinone/menaquinone biosynthesis C-methylase UbiE